MQLSQNMEGNNMLWRTIVVALLVGASIGGTANAADKARLIWGYVNPSSYYWDVYAAIDLGLMDRENLDVEAMDIPNAGQGGQLLISSSVDILSSNMEVAISAVDHGADIVFVGGELARATFALTARPDIDTIADLKGKTLGVTSYTEASTTMLKLLLRKNGIPEGAYDMVTVGGTPTRLAALLSGAISATMLSQPADFRAQEQGMKFLGYAYEAFDGPVVSFAVQKAWAARNSGSLVGFLRATAKAADWLFDHTNKDRAVAILQHYAKVSKADGDKNYDLWYGQRSMMARHLDLPATGVQAYLDLHGSKENPAKYLDMSFARRALEGVQLP